MQNYEIPQNCPFSLPFPTVIAFHRVKKSSLIIGIVDRIKINSEQPLPFSESAVYPIRSGNCTYNLRLFRLFCDDSSGVYKFPTATCMAVMV